MHIHFILLTAMLLLSGCATKYQPYSLWGTGGYQDVKIATDRYSVRFTTNIMVGSDERKKMLLYRCAEVTLAAKSDYFEVVKENLTFTNNTRTETYLIRLYRGEPKDVLEGMYMAKKVIENYKEVVMN